MPLTFTPGSMKNNSHFWHSNQHHHKLGKCQACGYNRRCVPFLRHVWCKLSIVLRIKNVYSCQQVITARSQLRCVRFCFSAVTCLYMKYLANRWTDLHQIHMACLADRPRLKVKIDFGGLRAVYVWKNIFTLVFWMCFVFVGKATYSD